MPGRKPSFEGAVSRTSRVADKAAPRSTGKSAIVAAFLCLTVSGPATAEFLLDMTAEEVGRYYGDETIAGLAIDETAYVMDFDASFCVEDGRLFIDASAPITRPLDILSGFFVRRLAADAVALDIDIELDTANYLRNTTAILADVGKSMTCAWRLLHNPLLRLFEVQTVDGHANLSELVEAHLQYAAEVNAGSAIQVPHWADDRYPDIDYSHSGFDSARYGSAEVIGHWMIREDRAEIDDSPRIMADTFAPSLLPRVQPELLLQCIENETRIIFVVDQRISPDPRTHQVTVEFRLDSEPARSERWSTSTSERATGLWGGRSVAVVRSMLGHDSLYIRVSDNRNRRFDETFDIRGIDEVAERVAAACGWSTLSLSHTDYMAVQQGLRRLGFYDGAIDGAWGPMSQAAMRAFQDANGLAVTGVPDRSSLDLLEE